MTTDHDGWPPISLPTDSPSSAVPLSAVQVESIFEGLLMRHCFEVGWSVMSLLWHATLFAALSVYCLAAALARIMVWAVWHPRSVFVATAFGFCLAVLTAEDGENADEKEHTAENS
jgi:hypothetical protein